MRLVKGVWVVLAIAALAVVGTLVLSACGEDEADITRPTVQYLDQTFALLVCDGNGNTSNPWGWAHDGAEVCTLDWNNDGSGSNRLPVTYVYNQYPVVDGAVTADSTLNGALVEGDKDIWAQAPWVTIPVHPVYGGGSGITSVKAKAVFTYVNPPRVWFLFQWEDGSKTIRGNPDDGPDAAGTLQYHWYCAPGFNPINDGFTNNRQWNAREDWLGLIWSTWFIWNTNDAGKAKSGHSTADLEGYDWKCVETIPGFQANGLNAIKGSGTTPYMTKAVITSNNRSPYFDKYYNGPYADFWYMGASRCNYTSGGAWDATEGAFAFDCSFGTAGFTIPNSAETPSHAAIEETMPWDSGVTSYITNPPDGWAGSPGRQNPADPADNPPGATYLWNTAEASPNFNNAAAWKEKAVLAGYLHRPCLGSAGDIRCRFSWWDPDEKNYEPYDGDNHNYQGEDPALKFPSRKDNEIAKKWNYTLEIEREIGTLAKNKDTEDVLLGIFTSHPGE